ncbi:Mysoin-binding motif of peroxisomes-domain-containing protein [Gigaspora margarita]|uniref:Vezatin n=1 Tax=Gigaspora margarita TaxID=4874 RepID=A0A8H3XCX0_GIGMA|nr:Mysoin-binding motif of peroxisomes-domain-containing protein [Gigaspora margarita]
MAEKNLVFDHFAEDHISVRNKKRISLFVERQRSQIDDDDESITISRFSQGVLNIFEYLQETLSIALPLQEENEFEERFKYLLCTSHLLNDTLSVYFYDSKKPDPIEISDAGLYLGGISRRNFEILLSSVIGMIVVVLTWLLHGSDSKDIGTKIMQLPIAFMLALCCTFFLYRRMRRKAMKTLHSSALYFLEMLVYNCQNFDIKLNKALTMIQEIELVSRGYRLSMPLTEQCSEDRRCGVFRETIHDILREAFESYCDAVVAMNPETLKNNLAIMYNMYNIIPHPEDDEWNLEEQDSFSLEFLKQCFQKMHTKRRELLCHFLALDIMTPGRDSGRTDYEQHWVIVNEHLNNLGVVTGIYLDRIIATSAIDLYTIPTPKQDFLSQPIPQIITNKKLKTYLHRLASVEQRVRSIQAKLYICNEDVRKYHEAEAADTSEDEIERLIKQYESISNDFVYIFQEWEDGKKALKDVTEPISVDPDLSSSRQSLEEDTETLKDEDENRSEKTLTIDWSQIDEPLDILEQVFEANAKVEYITKAKSEELDAFIHQKISSEDKILHSSPEKLERIQLHGNRVAIATN